MAVDSFHVAPAGITLQELVAQCDLGALFAKQ